MSSKAGKGVLRIRDPNQNHQVPNFPAVNIGDTPIQPTNRDKYYVGSFDKSLSDTSQPSQLSKIYCGFP